MTLVTLVDPLVSTGPFYDPLNRVRRALCVLHDLATSVLSGC